MRACVRVCVRVCAAASSVDSDGLEVSWGAISSAAGGTWPRQGHSHQRHPEGVCALVGTLLTNALPNIIVSIMSSDLVV